MGHGLGSLQRLMDRIGFRGKGSSSKSNGKKKGKDKKKSKKEDSDGSVKRKSSSSSLNSNASSAHGAADPGTVSRTSHSSEVIPFRHRGSSSPTARDTGLQIIKWALSVLDLAPIPGISAITQTLMTAMAASQEMGENTQGWKELVQRLGSLSHLVKRYETAGLNSRMANRLCTALGSLRDDIQLALNQRAVVRFFNSTDSSLSIMKHNQDLDRLILELIAHFGIHSHNTVQDLRKELQEFQEELRRGLSSRPAAQDQPSGEMHQVFTEWIEMDDGNVGITAPNQFTGPVKASQEFRGAIKVGRGNVGITFG